MDAPVRMVREMTGVHVRVLRECATFIQEGTPAGTMPAHCCIARIIGGSLIKDGPEGPAAAYRLDTLPAIMPIRVANQRALGAYLKQRGSAQSVAACPDLTTPPSPPQPDSDGGRS